MTWVECNCDPEYSHHCPKCNGTGHIRMEIVNRDSATGTIKPLPLGPIHSHAMQLDARGKVYAKLDAEELQNIAKAVIDELRKENRNFHPATLSL